MTRLPLLFLMGCGLVWNVSDYSGGDAGTVGVDAADASDAPDARDAERDAMADAFDGGVDAPPLDAGPSDTAPSCFLGTQPQTSATVVSSSMPELRRVQINHMAPGPAIIINHTGAILEEVEVRLMHRDARGITIVAGTTGVVLTDVRVTKEGESATAMPAESQPALSAIGDIGNRVSFTVDGFESYGMQGMSIRNAFSTTLDRVRVINPIGHGTMAYGAIEIRDSTVTLSDFTIEGPSSSIAVGLEVLDSIVDASNGTITVNGPSRSIFMQGRVGGLLGKLSDIGIDNALTGVDLRATACELTNVHVIRRPDCGGSEYAFTTQSLDAGDVTCSGCFHGSDCSGEPDRGGVIMSEPGAMVTPRDPIGFCFERGEPPASF